MSIDGDDRLRHPAHERTLHCIVLAIQAYLESGGEFDLEIVERAMALYLLHSHSPSALYVLQGVVEHPLDFEFEMTDVAGA